MQPRDMPCALAHIQSPEPFEKPCHSQVETTFSKGMMRLVTTAIGGGLAALIMMSPVLATNPYYLTILMMVFNFVCGLAIFTEVGHWGRGGERRGLQKWTAPLRCGSMELLNDGCCVA